MHVAMICIFFCLLNRVIQFCYNKHENKISTKKDGAVQIENETQEKKQTISKNKTEPNRVCLSISISVTFIFNT